jgi:signal transduction histidine kinase
MARDLHDGLAQELAYISRHIDLLNGEAESGTVRRLKLALQRAQLESRRAINALAATGNQPLEVALADAAEEIAERYRINLDLELASGVRLSPTRSEALVRIACEAVTNAARHSGAREVTLCLERDGSLTRLRVSDKGRGFDTAVPGSGFGLVAMRERARSVGAELRIDSAAGRGSEVEVAV